MLRKLAKWSGIALGAVVLVLGGYVALEAASFGSSMKKVYAVPLPDVHASTDSAVVARGEHLVEAVAGCSSSDCHGADLAGGSRIDVGPVGSFQAPNITAAGLGKTYSDAELARLIQHGIKRDGTSVRFMPVQDFSWLPETDVQAIVSYVRSVPAVERPSGQMKVGLLGRLLDRRDLFVLDVARRIDHEHKAATLTPTPDARYGAFLARGCYGCHGEHLSGGPIPGAPSSMAVPLNLTPDHTGLAGWTYDDFAQLLATGVDKKGKKLDPMMPVASLDQMDDVEKHALWAYLQSLPARPFGRR
jgi:mono/diheme cytochrome c family protein